MFCLLLLVTGCGKPDSKTPAPQVAPVAKSPTPKVDDAAKRRRPNAKRAAPNAVMGSTNSEPEASIEQDTTPATEVVYRHSYRQRVLNVDELAGQGLKVVVAEPMRLVTDVDAEDYEPLMGTVGPLMKSLEDYFGKLPPAKTDMPFQVTGYVMLDRDKFAKANLLPPGELLQYHGRQINAEFWMNQQSLSYYRAHLFAHEFTHAFMMHLPNANTDMPQWYLEGMAELFGTHQRDRDGIVQFGVMPSDATQLRGWERIALVRRDIAFNGLRSMRDIVSLEVDDFARVESYAWSWAFCRFLASHPRYRDRFQQVTSNFNPGGFAPRFKSVFSTDATELNVEWKLFASQLCYGFDFERAAIDFKAGQALSDENRTTRVAANRGWQDTGIFVTAGQSYQIRAPGQLTLATSSKPWISEANGISIRYANGQPLGRLIACVRTTEESPESQRAPLVLVPLGNVAKLVPPVSGTLLLRVNDDWSELADNSGEFRVEISTE